MTGKRIIIVDDEQDICEFLKYNLLKEGFVVRTFNNPREALHEISTFHPSLIITDWLMPTMTGLEFSRLIKSSPDTSYIPVVMLSCKGDDDDLKRAYEVGVDDYMIKPFRTNELVYRIKKILSESKEYKQYI